MMFALAPAVSLQNSPCVALARSIDAGKAALSAENSIASSPGIRYTSPMDGTQSTPGYEGIALNPQFRHVEGALLHALLQSTDYGVLVSGLDRQDIIANRRLGELFRVPPRDVVETDPDAVRAYALSCVRDPERFESLLRLAYADPNLSFTDEIELIGDPIVTLRRYTGPIHDPQGTVIGRLWTFLDISETKRLTHRLQSDVRSALESLQVAQRRMVEMEKLRTAGILAASVAHDIRNILTALQMEVETQPAAVAEPIMEQLNRFSALTHRLLAFSGNSVLETQPTVIADVLRRIVPLISGQAQINNVELALDLPQDQPCVSADASELEHLFVNLCLNAIQAMSAEGGQLRLVVREAGEWLRIRVEDTGCGIAPEVINRLFDPFFTTRATGTGLGLFSCKRIVEEHGGQITVESRPAVGTCFTVLLPICPAPTSGVQAAGRGSHAPRFATPTPSAQRSA